MSGPVRIASLLVLAVLSGACGEESLVPGDDATGGISHPAGEREIVLRVEDTGGFVPLEFLFTRLPSFSLLGDGTVVTEGPQIEIFPPPALPNLQARTVTEDGIQRILEEARVAGLFGPDRHYDYPLIADASTTEFILVAEGERHKVSAYALGFGEEEPRGEGPPPGLSAEDVEARRKLAAFRRRISDLGSWLPEGSVGEEHAYELDAMRVIVRPGTPPEEQAEPKPEERDWPLPTAAASFGEPLGEGTRCGAVRGEDLETMLGAARRANQITLWRGEGRLHNAWFRPLLPDEPDCPPPG